MITDYELHFGIELELCVKVDDDCVSRKVARGYQQSSLQKLSFYEKMDLLLQNGFIEPTEKIPRVAIQEGKAYGSSEPKRYLYPDKDGNKRIAPVSKSETHMNIKRYKYPILVSDITLICGDYDLEGSPFATLKSELNKHQVSYNTSFAFEFITPVLVIPLKEEPITEEEVREKLEPYFKFINLINRNSCFIVNASTGFHINVSIYNTKTQQTVDYNDRVFAKKLYDIYSNFEKDNYFEFMRKRTAIIPGTSQPNIAFYAQPVSFLNSNTSVYPSYVLKPDFKNFSFMNVKESSLHRKERGGKKNIIEFRAYQAETDVNTLYTNTAKCLNTMATAFLEATKEKMTSASLPLTTSQENASKGGKRKTKGRKRKTSLHLRNSTRRAAK